MRVHQLLLSLGLAKASPPGLANDASPPPPCDAFAQVRTHLSLSLSPARLSRLFSSALQRPAHRAQAGARENNNPPFQNPQHKTPCVAAYSTVRAMYGASQSFPATRLEHKPTKNQKPATSTTATASTTTTAKKNTDLSPDAPSQRRTRAPSTR